MSRDNFIDIFQDSSEISEEEKKNNQLNRERMFSRMESFIAEPDDSDYQIDPGILRKGRLKSEKEYWDQFELLSEDKRSEFLRDTLSLYDIFISQIHSLYVKRKRKWEAANDYVDHKFKEAHPDELRMIVEGLGNINSERLRFLDKLKAIEPDSVPEKIIWRGKSNLKKAEELIEYLIWGKAHDIILNARSVQEYVKRIFVLEENTSSGKKGDYIIWSGESVRELLWWVRCLFDEELIFIERNINKNRNDKKPVTKVMVVNFIINHFRRFKNDAIKTFGQQYLQNAYSKFRDFEDDQGFIDEEELKFSNPRFFEIREFIQNHLGQDNIL